MDNVIYRGMNQATLDAAYNNAAAIGEKRAAYLADWVARSAVVRNNTKIQRDIRYGESGREALDFFSADRARAPTLVFIHGGYWQMGNKEDSDWLAVGALSHGINFINVEYTLTPAISMDGIVSQVRAAIA